MVLVPMETVTEYADHKTELEERIRSLESERASLLNDIAALKEKIATFELEKAATSLENEVESLRTEKAVLEEKVAAFASEDTYAEQPQPAAEGYQA
jgi:3-phenylpropionate/cinnamic acid dioxygenase small subunit